MHLNLFHSTFTFSFNRIVYFAFVGEWRQYTRERFFIIKIYGGGFYSLLFFFYLLTIQIILFTFTSDKLVFSFEHNIRFRVSKYRGLVLLSPLIFPQPQSPLPIY